MKIRRFVAKDMRTALEQIKMELGADAVIMSNKKIPEGVELMAAVDYGQQVAPASQPQTDASLPKESIAQEPMQRNNNAGGERAMANDVVSIGTKAPATSDVNLTAPAPVSNRSVQNHSLQNQSEQPEPADSLAALLQRQNQKPAAQVDTNENNLDLEQQLKNFTDRLERGAKGYEQPTQANAISQPTHSHSATATVSDLEPPHVPQVNEVTEQARATHTEMHMPTGGQQAEIERMRAEMASIRQLLEHQVSGLMWQDMAQKDPHKAMMVNRLTAMGLNDYVADQIASCIPDTSNEELAWEQAKQLLASQVNTTNNEIIHRGGVVSLVGPTGVGKTTTIAKLAARFAQIHGADQVVLISTDNYRIAGFEQLSTFARIIGCTGKQAKDAAELDTLLQQYSDKKLVLIDTAGMGQRDMRLTQQLTTLVGNSRVRIRNYLVLAANTQQVVMQENVERFKKIPLAGCIFTKLDESLSVGEIIATAVQNGLPIGYLTDGQRVPEDIKVANAEKLVTLADKLAARINRQNNWRQAPTSYAVGM